MADTHRRQPPAGGDVTVRPASTVMVVRDGDHPSAPLEVLMVRRSLQSDFVGGAYVFPGGALDPEDGGTDAEALCTGRADAEASALLGLPEGGLGYWVAALRECFEEAGLLLATRGSTGELVSMADVEDARRFAWHRQEVNGGRRTFLEVCREEGLHLPLEHVHYFSHWITPVGRPRRYDTRFFVAAAPPDQTPAHDAGEVIADLWVRPADALAQHRSGEIEIIFPTVRTLQAIGRFATAGDLLAAAAAATVGGEQPTVPRMVVDGNGSRLLLPGDPGYDDAGATPPPAGTDIDEAIRAASLAANRSPLGDPPPAEPPAEPPDEPDEPHEPDEPDEPARTVGGGE